MRERIVDRVGARDVSSLLLLTAAWALVIALVGLGGDFPLNDDWSYAVSARSLHGEGQLRFSSWHAPLGASHALWGAAALHLLGDSYVSLRVGTLLWALVGLFAAYGIARCLLPPARSLVVALALGLSPWFVNLSFTYMTDVPWLAMILLALLPFVHALRSDQPRPALLIGSGTLLGIAALTRQHALAALLPFALVLALHARGHAGARWRGAALGSFALVAAPVAALLLPFQVWYTLVHGATARNRALLAQVLEVRPWHVLLNLLCILHYAGLWLFPLAVALALQRRTSEVVTRRQALWALAVLGGFAVGCPIFEAVLQRPGHVDGPADTLHPWMPYLGNILYLVGLGPPTTTDVYLQQAPPPHAGAWAGVLLTIVSTFGGVVGAGLLATAWRRVRERSAREPVRLLLVSFAAVYLSLQLATGTQVFDRYLLPLLVVVVLLAVDAMPRAAVRSPALAALAVLSGALSVAGTREYLGWNAARSVAVHALVDHGVRAEEIDGGFEVNGPVEFEKYVQRTGKFLAADGWFWISDARYRVSLSPNRDARCTLSARYPYWTFAGEGSVEVVECRSREREAVSAAIAH